LPSAPPTLTEFELRYPFISQSRKFFESMPLEEELASKDVIQQAGSRLMNALGRASYEPHLSELIEFSSFFAAALVASQDSNLTSKFAKKESERSREFFVKETADAKVAIIAECFLLSVKSVEGEEGRRGFCMPFEDYLALVAKYELAKASRWKLARQALQEGIIYVGDNTLNDLFSECAQRAIADGVKNLRRGVFPKQLLELRTSVVKYVPAQKARSTRAYAYVEELLKHPVSDGRHRLVWLVLAPYLVNVKKLQDEEAIDKIRGFVSVGGETADMRRFVEYNVRRARRNGLMPPTFSKLRTEHPDIYSLLPAAALSADASKIRTQRPQETK
jgi:hypothetical protein